MSEPQRIELPAVRHLLGSYVGKCHCCGERITYVTHRDMLMREDICVVCSHDLIWAEQQLASVGIRPPEALDLIPSDDFERREFV